MRRCARRSTCFSVRQSEPTRSFVSRVRPRTPHTLLTGAGPMGPPYQRFACADTDTAFVPLRSAAGASGRVHACHRPCLGRWGPAAAGAPGTRVGPALNLVRRVTDARTSGEEVTLVVLVDTSAARCCVCALLGCSRRRPGAHGLRSGSLHAEPLSRASLFFFYFLSCALFVCRNPGGCRVF